MDKRRVLSSGIMGGARIPFYKLLGIPLVNVIAAYQGVGASSYERSKVNLVNPGTYDLIDSGHAPIWSTTGGWLFDGISQYFNTGYDIVGHHAIFVFTRAVSGGQLVAGVGTASPARAISIYPISTYWYTTVYYEDKNGSNTSNLNFSQDGVHGLSKTGYYKDGFLMKTLSEPTIPNYSIPLYIGAKNSDGSPINYFGGQILGAVIVNITPTDSQMLSASNSIYTLSPISVEIGGSRYSSSINP